MERGWPAENSAVLRDTKHCMRFGHQATGEHKDPFGFAGRQYPSPLAVCSARMSIGTRITREIRLVFSALPIPVKSRAVTYIPVSRKKTDLRAGADIATIPNRSKPGTTTVKAK